MTSHVPTRLTAVWPALLVATCATWWLGTGHLGGRGASWEVLSLIVVACVKIHLVGYDFMEVRGAPRPLRVLFSAWVAAVAVAVAVLAVT